MTRTMIFLIVTATLSALPTAAVAQESASLQTDEPAVEATTPAIAQEEPDDEEEADEPIFFFGSETVTATGVVIDTFDIPTPVIVIDAARIEEILPDSAADLLRGEPGVDVNGVGPSQTRPIIRGHRGSRVLFLQDGLRMNNARRQTDFGEITSLVDVSNVQTLEVVRGSGSVLYGSDAIGGVLNLITKVPPAGSGKQFTGSLGLRFSTADDQSKADVSISGRANKFSYAVGASVRDASDYEAPAGSFGEIDLDEDIVVIDTGVEDESYNSYLGVRLNDRHSIFFRANAYSSDNAGFGYVDPALIGDTSGLFIIDFPFQDFERYTLGYLASGLQSAVASTIDIRAYTQSNERDNGFFADINIGALFGPGANSSVVIDSLIFSDLDTDGFRAEVTKTIGEKNLLTYGVEYYEDDSFNTRGSQTTTILRAVFPIDFICGPAGAVPFPFECVFPAPFDTRPSAPNATNKGQGIFIQNAFYPTSRFSTILGVRFAKSETIAKPTPGWDITGLDFDDDDVVGALNLVYGVSDNVNLVASYSTAFRAPNIIERLFNGLTPEGAGFQVLNPGLTSESSENIDIGIKYRSANAFFEAIYFDNEVDDAIIIFTLSAEEIAALPPEVQDELSQAGGNLIVAQNRNAEVFKVDGFEIAGGYRFDNGFSLGGNFTKLDGEAEMGGPAEDPTGDTFSEKFNGYLRYDRPSGRWWVESRVRHNGEEDMALDPAAVVSPIGEVLPEFTVHDLAAGVTLFENSGFRHTLGLVVTNVSDELYAEFSNATFFRPQPKRRVIASYRFRF